MAFFDSVKNDFVSSPGGGFLSEFFSQPLDLIFLDMLIYLGWLPIVMVLIAGLLEVWKDRRQIHWHTKQRTVLLAIDVPRDSEQSPKAVENIFAACTIAAINPNFKEKWIEGKEHRPFSFEIVSVDGYIQYYVRLHIRFRDMLESAIYAQYPDAEIREAEDYTQNVPDEYPDETYDMYGYEFILAKEEYLPLRTWPLFEHSLSQEMKDPLGALLESLSKIKKGEQIWLQFILIGCGDRWKEEGDAYIKELFGTKEKAKPTAAEKFFAPAHKVLATSAEAVLGLEQGADKDADFKEEMWKAFKVTEQERETAKAVVTKISKPGFKTKIRYVYVGRREVFKKGWRNDMLKGFFRQFDHLNLNKFKRDGRINPKDDYVWQRWFYVKRQNKLMKAYKLRAHTRGATPYVLNTEELATLWHFPTIEIKAPLISKTVSKRAEPPSQLTFAGEADEQVDVPTTSFASGGDEESTSSLTFEIEGASTEETQSGGAGPGSAGEEPKPAPGSVVEEGAIENVLEGELPQVEAPTAASESPVPQTSSGSLSEIPEALRVMIDPDAGRDVPADSVNQEEHAEAEAPDNIPT